MPTYDYECPTCDDVTEVVHGMTQKPRVKCAVCGSRRRKMIGTGAGIIFKGGGFYETDYRSASYKAGQKTDAPADTSSSSDKAASSGSGKSDAKGSSDKKSASAGTSAKASTSKAKADAG